MYRLPVSFRAVAVDCLGSYRSITGVSIMGCRFCWSQGKSDANQAGGRHEPATSPAGGIKCFEKGLRPPQYSLPVTIFSMECSTED